ncbi:MAG: P-loop NTPase fold protein [bacterium]
MKQTTLLKRTQQQYSKFKDYFSDPGLITANLIVIIKTVFFGILFVEVFYFSQAFSLQLNNAISKFGHEGWIILGASLGIITTLFYVLIRDTVQDLCKFYRSYRFDVLTALCFGIWIDVAWGGFLYDWYKKLVISFSFQQLLILVFAPVILTAFVIFRSISWKKKETESNFLSDHELKERKNDLLNLADKANKFAERVFNNGNSESFVFGVDAPWGIGKSSFINFCKEHWDENQSNKTVIFKFNPLRYAGSKNLLEVFVDGLIHSIQKDSFVPEIKPLISRYARLLREVNRFSIFGFSLPTLTVDYTADEAFDDLNAVLKRFKKKVIIIVDDLDRMTFSEIKDILFVIRKSFVLPNISYVLCYDTENIGILESETPDAEKISEFLEKFVNIKISLFLDKENLAKYVSDNLDKAVSTKLVDPILVRQALGGLLDIYKSSGYHNYLPFIGDVRKLKRLINTVVLFELESTDFQNTDFDKQDLIHLLLIYIHFPNIFRKIYDSETNGSRGFFSLVLPHEDGYPIEDSSQRRGSFSESEYKNSTYYTEYIKHFPDMSRQKFLLDRIFDVNVRLGTNAEFPHRDTYARIDGVSEDIKTSYACFNGGWTNGRNLEAYLRLIVEFAKPEDTEQHRFYANWKDEIASGSKTIEDAFADPKFAFDKGEFTRAKLWRIIVNNARSLPPNISNILITHLLDNLPDYSHIEIENIGVGLRKDSDLFLIRLLNDAGWSDDSGKHSGNTEKNIKEIAEWIFGEGEHSGCGVLEKLSLPTRGVLGLYDLMAFRLYCSADRGGDIFDLSRALSKHSDKGAPTEGNTQVIAKEEMREISQKVFDIFKKQYIDTKRNIFEEISNLELKDLAGQYKDYLESQVINSKISQGDLDKQVAVLKSIITGFTIYQLGNSIISSGVGCGYYDPTGNDDRHQIADAINDYIFDVCFNPSSPENVEHFIDYLLRNFASVFASAREDGRNYIPHINEFTKVLHKEKLAEYWQKNSSAIKAMNLNEKEKTLYVGNYTATYREDLAPVFKVLDDYLAEVVNAEKINSDAITPEVI